MSLQGTKSEFRSKLAQVGRNALHTLFPKDIEAYFIALELVDSRGRTVDYFAWPILPSEIRERQTELTTIRKTMGGVNVTKNPTFNPIGISMRGDFGREFKLILGGQQIVFAGFGMSIADGKFDIVSPNLFDSIVPQFSTFAKTGYGCVKLLEAIKNKSNKLDKDGKSFSLYLYNPILGNNYQVEFNSFEQMQDDSHYNMYPAYSLQLTAVAPLDSILSRRANIRSTIKNLTISNFQKTANSIAANLRLVRGLGT